jgi:hypothetical protein
MKQDNSILWLLGLGAAALFLAPNVGALSAPATEPADLTPSDPEEVSGLGALGQTMVYPSNWFDLSGNVKILIPFPQRSVAAGAGLGKVQFLYNGRWYDGQNLLRVWNPIRSLPSWLR